jgi:hypothetical protein
MKGQQGQKLRARTLLAQVNQHSCFLQLLSTRGRPGQLIFDLCISTSENLYKTLQKAKYLIIYTMFTVPTFIYSCHTLIMHKTFRNTQFRTGIDTNAYTEDKKVGRSTHATSSASSGHWHLLVPRLTPIKLKVFPQPSPPHPRVRENTAPRKYQ